MTSCIRKTIQFISKNCSSDIGAGESAALVHKIQPAAEIVREIHNEAQAILLRTAQRRRAASHDGQHSQRDTGIHPSRWRKERRVRQNRTSVHVTAVAISPTGKSLA